jgi:hypothetical protein
MLRLRSITPVNTAIADAASGKKSTPTSTVTFEYEFDCGTIDVSIFVALRDTDEEMISVGRSEAFKAMRNLLDTQN